MKVSKIHLSSSEMELMQNAEIILTKNRVLEKMKVLLEEVQHKQTEFVQNNIPDNEIFARRPKISKGENYLGLPYLILDYPRFSANDNFFFIRTMFWWGNFFSCTLHLSGRSKEIFLERIKPFYVQLKNYYISIHADPWVHHLQEPDYRKIDSLSKEEFEQGCKKFDHIKIAAKHSLTEWERMPVELYENWKFLLYVCGLIA